MKVIETIRTINRGGFGIVEEVRCDDGNTYAKKTFCPNIAVEVEQIKKWRDRFIREVKTQKQLQSEFIMPIIISDLSGDEPWYLMPIAEYDYNKEIEDCKSEGRMPNGLSDILNALEYIHNLGFVHRDLKPGNILYHDNKWKLSDFGLITQDKEILSLSITSSNGLGAGTPMYSAPEQINNFKLVDKRADIYSFGAILHDIFGNICRTPYSNFRCQGEIGIIIDKCSKREPKQRFQNIESLRNNLLYILSKRDNNISNDIEEKQQKQIDKFRDLSQFNLKKLEDLIFYLREEDNDTNILFRELNNDILNHIYNIDKDYFIEFSLIYVEWVKESSFIFDYCDVIIIMIKNIYSKTQDIDLKAKCVISAARLAKTHNRWFVMRKVIDMANSSIEDNLAFRLKIEIENECENKINFNRCLEGIGLSENSYHPLIREAL